jgi:hypothetical protein
MADSYSRIAVLGAFQAFQYGAEHVFAGRLVLFEGFCFAGEGSRASRQPGPTLRGQDAPGEQAVRALQSWVRAPLAERLLQCGVQGFRLLEGDGDLVPRVAG